MDRVDVIAALLRFMFCTQFKTQLCEGRGVDLLAGLARYIGGGIVDAKRAGAWA